MTGYQSKKAAALDEEGMYLVHQTQPAQVKVEGPLHVVCQCDKCKAQPAQEPVGKFAKFTDGVWREVTNGSAGIPLYTAPPQRPWVGLTDEDLEPLCNEWRIVFGSWAYEFAKAIEAKLKEKNT